MGRVTACGYPHSSHKNSNNAEWFVSRFKDILSVDDLLLAITREVTDNDVISCHTTKIEED